MNILKKTTTYYVVQCDFCKEFNKTSPDNWWKSENFLNLVMILICSHIWLTVSNKLYWLACCHLECYRWHKREFIGEMLESGLKNIIHKLTWARKKTRRNLKVEIWSSTFLLKKKINLTHTGLAAIHVKGFGS